MIYNEKSKKREPPKTPISGFFFMCGVFGLGWLVPTPALPNIILIGHWLQVCREHQAQYFYMAPKFPYSLPFDNQVRGRVGTERIQPEIPHPKNPDLKDKAFLIHFLTTFDRFF